MAEPRKFLQNILAAERQPIENGPTPALVDAEVAVSNTPGYIYAKIGCKQYWFDKESARKIAEAMAAISAAVPEKRSYKVTIDGRVVGTVDDPAKVSITPAG